MLRNTTDSWGTGIKFFHWLMAALIVFQIMLGVMAVTWPVSPTKLDLFVWHKSFGVLILTLAALRLLWRLTNVTPALPEGMAGWERIGARVSHFLLYLLMLALPLTGWIINSAANIPFRIFWLVPLPAIVAPDKALADLFAQIHGGLALALVVVLVAHIGAALRHHFIKHDQVLIRMLPGG
jgi:cytochrome b561